MDIKYGCQDVLSVLYPRLEAEISNLSTRKDLFSIYFLLLGEKEYDYATDGENNVVASQWALGVAFRISRSAEGPGRPILLGIGICFQWEGRWTCSCCGSRVSTSGFYAASEEVIIRESTPEI